VSETLKRIIIMDDSEVVLHAVKAFLLAKGYDVGVAANLTELETAIGQGRPDLFVLDVQMPEMFGDDVAQVLREVRSMEVPVILFSDIDEAMLRIRGREAGVAACVTKRAGMGALVAQIEQLVA
jgi:two-component system OmpR family response regulator